MKDDKDVLTDKLIDHLYAGNYGVEYVDAEYFKKQFGKAGFVVLMPEGKKNV